MQFSEKYWELRDAIRRRLFAHLNEEQFKAVEKGSGPVLCLAGAGSGKTTAMVYRVLHLYLFGPEYEKRPKPPEDLSEGDLRAMQEWLDNQQNSVLPPRIIRLVRTNGVPPRSIMAITFTNKAAGEMENRLAAVLGGTAREMWVMNFHKTCVRILRREITKLGYNTSFTIYDEQDQLQVIKKVLARLNLDEKTFPPRAISALISRFKCELQGYQALKRKPLDYWQEKGALVYEYYQKELEKNNALDFDDLIMLTVRLFREQPEVLEKYQARFKYLLVDEYQDTNHAQYVLVSLLAGRHQNLFVVGDDDQSIYGFRQADIRNILEFERDFPQACTFKLECNYRSTGRILEAANEVIRHNRGRKSKVLWTNNPPGEPLVRFCAEDEQDEARFIAERIMELAREGEGYQDCAVLLRTNAQSRVLEEWFMKKGIPYRIVGGQKFYERMEIKDILAYLKVLANPKDSVSLRRIINVPRRGIGEATIQKVEEHALLNGLHFYEGLKQHAQIGLNPKALKGMEFFVQLMDKLYEKVNEVSVTTLTENILDMTGYAEGLMRENSIESLSRLENIKEFLTVTQDYDEKAEAPSLADFLNQVSLVTDLDSYEEEVNAVVIMTMHMAKGLEFKNVFLAGLEEGIFPHARSLLEDNLEEERRLCYVALTRAQKRIYLLNARQRNLFGRRNYNLPSRFLEEIPAGLWEEYQREDDFFRTRPAPASSTGDKGGQLLVGDKVEHLKWGQGVIVGSRGQGEDTELQIAFPGQGIKTVLTRYAPLKEVK